jgi:hypothetical protein
MSCNVVYIVVFSCSFNYCHLEDQNISCIWEMDDGI